MARRTFVGRPRDEVGERTARLVAVDGQRRGDGIADPDDRVPPRDPIAAGGVAHPERPVDLLGPQSRGRRVDLVLDRSHLVGVDLRSDRGVDERADRLGQRFIDGAHPLDFLGCDVPDMCELQHPRTRTRF
jgi:hypothetical protein